MLPFLLALSCAPEATPTPGTCGDPDSTLTGVFAIMRLGEADPVTGAVWGFDLDGRVSDAADYDGCNKPDGVDPEGRQGVDNGMANLWPIIANTEAVAVAGLIQDGINNGELLLLVELTHVDDWQNDDCVGMNIVRGLGPPLVGTDGLLLDGQTLPADPDSPALHFSDLALVDGRVEAGPFDLTLDFYVLAAQIEFALRGGWMRVDVDAQGRMSGFFGGAIAGQSLVDLVLSNAIDAELQALVESAIPIVTDMGRNQDTSQCEDLSLVLEYEGVSAFLFE